MTNPTPTNRLLDTSGRPYFLWDRELTDEQFRALLCDPDPQVRTVAIGVLMRQAKPDDVFLYITEAQIRESWEQVQRFLGNRKAFWSWLLDIWSQIDAE